jgi:hypothetical protein
MIVRGNIGEGRMPEQFDPQGSEQLDDVWMFAA